MIDQHNGDNTGFARFSDDMTMRYRLAGSLTGRVYSPGWANGGDRSLRSVVFVLLNPSTADAFKPDPTSGECEKRARAFGADILEIVNLFAFRSAYPTDLPKRAIGQRGDDATNAEQILAACTGAAIVIAGWGNHGALDYRDRIVRSLLRERGVELHHLGLTQGGYPKHPLARGKHRIPADLAPVRWAP